MRNLKQHESRMAPEAFCGKVHVRENASPVIGAGRDLCGT